MLEARHLLARDLAEVNLARGLRLPHRHAVGGFEGDEQARAAARRVAHPLNRDVVEGVVVGREVHALQHERRRLPRRALQRAEQHRAELGVHDVEHVEPLPPVAHAEELARARERVHELPAVAHEEARRHVLREQRVVRPEELRDRVPRARGRHRRRGLGPARVARLEARLHVDAGVAVLAVHAPVPIDDLEVVEERPRALARPEEHDAAAVQREVEQAERLLLGGRLQVDEQVPARDEIDARERRIANDVVLREDDHAAKLGDDLVAARPPPEVALEPLGRDVRDGALVVDAARGVIERPAVDVGREDLDGPRAELLRELVEEDGERVDLLAGRAAGDPRPERRPLRQAREDLRQDALAEDLERLLVAEETRHPDEEIAVEDVELVAPVAQALDVRLEVLGARELEAPLDAAGHRARLVVREVDAELALEHVVHGGEAVDRAVGEGRLEVRAQPHALGVLGQHLGHLVRGQHPVGDARVARRLGHAVELRALVVLHEHEPPGLVHGADAARAVAAAAREHDGDRALPAVLRERAEEDVDGELELVLPIALAEEQAAARDDHLLLRGDEIDVVGQDHHAVLHHPDRQVRVPRQELVHHALEVGREVLHQHVGHAAVGRDAVEEALEGVEAPRRRADADDEGRHADLGGCGGVRRVRGRKDLGVVGHGQRGLKRRAGGDGIGRETLTKSSAGPVPGSLARGDRAEPLAERRDSAAPTGESRFPTQIRARRLHEPVPHRGSFVLGAVGGSPQRPQMPARSFSRSRSRALRVRDAARSNSARASSWRPSFSRRSARAAGSRW